jgi:LPS sulfotransferase NodH
MERLIIATTPRSGSNLLMYSLETHSRAVSGGEWYAKQKRPHLMAAWNNRNDRPESCNLLKVFSYNANEKTFPALLSSGVVVFLYRRDRAAQLASWKRACESGIWSEREPLDNLNPIPFRKDAAALIDRAVTLFAPIAAVQIAYEELVENWDDCIGRILNAAGWPVENIPQRLAKQTLGK